MNRLSNLLVRPSLEALEDRDVPSCLAAAFPGQGVWRTTQTEAPAVGGS